MDPGFAIALGLASLFFGGVGYMAWKEHKRRGLQVAEPPTWPRGSSRQIEEPKRKEKY